MALTVLPLVLGYFYLGLWHQSIFVPFDYTGFDQIWQLTLTKTVLDTGWVLNNPFMGAPDVAHWYQNPAAQTSAFHSVLLFVVGQFVRDAVATQQVYFLLNFSLIAVSAYCVCRLLKIQSFVAVCLGLLFAFLPTRFMALIFAYLSNYFVVPFAVIPAIWLLAGDFQSAAREPGTRHFVGELRSVLTNRRFLLGLLFVALVAATDGYYAFFSLLLLGFGTLVGLIGGRMRRPSDLVAPALLIFTLIGVALTVAAPLAAFEVAHPSEYAPQGVPDPALARHPFEAEVYSTTLKALVAPLGNNRIATLGQFGMELIKSADKERRYQMGQFASPGTFGGLLIFGMLAFIAVTLARNGEMPFAVRPGAGATLGRRYLGPIAALSLFVLLCSVTGGIGSLIAFIYPRIRAYERFPIFLTFLLFCGAGLIVTDWLATIERRRMRQLAFTAIGLVTVLAMLDETPYELNLEKDRPRYLAERAFVRKVEASLPDRSEIYQFPFSQYLTNNPYYGWGAFGQMRLYLHSRHLRWSNGASKNSPVDAWHTRMAALPIDQIVTEMQGAGFRGLIVDRVVVADPEYSALRKVLIARTGTMPLEDDVSRLAFWKLPDPGYTLHYASDFLSVQSVTVNNPGVVAEEPVSRYFNRAALRSELTKTGTWPRTIDAAQRSDLFVPSRVLDEGLGLVPITPITAMKGGISCDVAANQPLSAAHDLLTLHLTNRSGFDWQLNTGPNPLRIGMEKLVKDDGSTLRWDGGFRVRGAISVPSGATVDVQTPLAGVDLTTGVPNDGRPVTAVFALVQDGVEWFPIGGCRVSLVR